ncbi:MAG TPA: glycosyltransferase [Streptosporangiaceae bacterium]|nr:glycosyltransferase [Streptosporangiaceae bacterium]
MIKSVGITVPAHNEEDLLPACLDALRLAAQAVAGLTVQTIVVADDCADRTAAAALRRGVSVISVRAKAVGAARAAGMNELLRRFSGIDPRDLWLATTDADTTVPRFWLERQLSHADQGWDAVLGTVTVADWEDRPAHLLTSFAAHYEFGDAAHPHVHGANLGIRASAYVDVGGFSHLATAEDHALVEALAAAGVSALRAADIEVTTSARCDARAPHGFSHLLTKLAADA